MAAAQAGVELQSLAQSSAVWWALQWLPVLSMRPLPLFMRRPRLYMQRPHLFITPRRHRRFITSQPTWLSARLCGNTAALIALSINGCTSFEYPTPLNRRGCRFLGSVF
jgi:hypothetical protein